MDGAMVGLVDGETAGVMEWLSWRLIEGVTR